MRLIDYEIVVWDRDVVDVENVVDDFIDSYDFLGRTNIKDTIDEIFRDGNDVVISMIDADVSQVEYLINYLNEVGYATDPL